MSRIEIDDPRVEELVDRHVGRTADLGSEADVVRAALEVFDGLENRDEMVSLTRTDE